VAFLIERAIVIANPASRRGKRLAERARRALVERSIECDLEFTTHAGHATELALRHAPHYDAIFALGGDGTVMEVAAAMAGSVTPIGVLAAGTGNLLARALGIPLSVKHAVPALVDGEQIQIDLGRFDSGRRFAIAAGVGIDAAMVAETPSWLKHRLGVSAYTLMGARAAVRAVLHHEFFDTRVTIDGTVYERRAAAVMVANFGAVLGKRITLGPGIRTDDGLLDLCIFSPATLRDAVRIMWCMLRADFRGESCIFYRSGRSISVETSPALPWQADGDLIGTTPFTVVVEPLAVRLLVPRLPDSAIAHTGAADARGRRSGSAIFHE
jgi:diacylglycerol kinase (ATP)